MEMEDKQEESYQFKGEIDYIMGQIDILNSHAPRSEKVEPYNPYQPKQLCKCKFCNLDVRIDMLYTHELNCDMQLTKCQCNNYYFYGFYVQHIETCKDCQEQCQFCDQSFSPKNYEAHINKPPCQYKKMVQSNKSMKCPMCTVHLEKATDVHEKSECIQNLQFLIDSAQKIKQKEVHLAITKNQQLKDQINIQREQIEETKNLIQNFEQDSNNSSVQQKQEKQQFQQNDAFFSGELPNNLFQLDPEAELKDKAMYLAAFLGGNFKQYEKFVVDNVKLSHEQLMIKYQKQNISFIGENR